MISRVVYLVNTALRKIWLVLVSIIVYICRFGVRLLLMNVREALTNRLVYTADRLEASIGKEASSIGDVRYQRDLTDRYGRGHSR